MDIKFIIYSVRIYENYSYQIKHCAKTGKLKTTKILVSSDFCYEDWRGGICQIHIIGTKSMLL